MSDWYAYDWELHGSPARFRVDLSYLEAFDTLGDYTTLIWVSCFSKTAGADSFSAREKRELDAICRDLLAIFGEKCAFVGWIDVSAQRRFYFYTADARLLVPLTNFCAEDGMLSLKCGKLAEPNRQSYYRLLVPDAAKRQSVDNEAYIRSLRERGDDNATYRRVNLHMYFPSAQGRSLFCEEARKLSFAIGADDYIAERENPYFVMLHRVCPLEKQTVTALTTQAIALAEPYGGILEHFDSAFVPKRSLF